jgi:hypothetical protein
MAKNLEEIVLIQEGEIDLIQEVETAPEAKIDLKVEIDLIEMNQEEMKEVLEDTKSHSIPTWSISPWT